MGRPTVTWESGRHVVVPGTQIPQRPELGSILPVLPSTHESLRYQTGPVLDFDCVEREE